jgi:CBS domain-containing protein
MSVGRICSRIVHTATRDETARDAARRMRECGVGTLVVVDEAGHPAGLLTDRDLAVRVVAEGRDAARTRVEEVASPMPITVLEDTSIESALGTMRTGRLRRLPVVDGMNRVVGIVSLDDVLELVAEEFRLIGGLLEREAPRG